MERISIRKRFSWVMLLACLFFIGFTVSNAEAAAPPTVTTENFMVTYLSKNFDSIGITLKIPKDADGNSWYVDTQILYNGAVVAEDKNDISYASFNIALPKNRVYEYRIRLHDRVLNKTTNKYEEQYTGWTGTRVFSTIKTAGFKLTSKRSRTVKIRLPKVAGAKRVLLKMSGKKESGYRNVAKLTRGKLVKVSKFRGKSLVKYKNYYYRILVTALDGRTCDNTLEGYFYIY